ncbi:hypothetical protein D0T08_05325 [Emticicia sp. C21]|nr:hypothetical protein [Emticicia sp. C21]RFS17204.1 hypothetical protein D0T08_05325 [Emticicia sp. C21]
MTILESLWKVIVISPISIDNVNLINSTTQTIPNKQSITNRWEDYRLSIDELEDMTGNNFLSSVPQQIQNIIEK